MKKIIFLFLITACTNIPEGNKSMVTLDIQGHRGCRGLMPENTIPAFLRAIDLGVTTLEMDAVITQDSQVVLSHEPFFNHEISLKPNGEEISEAEEREHNIFTMTWEDVRLYDCGSKIHPRFPDQQKMMVSKPLLRDVIDAVETYAKGKGLPPLLYNIETKCQPATDNVFHPEPGVFAGLLMDVIIEKQITDRATIQSFDVRTLQIIRPQFPNQSLALLVENEETPEWNLAQLGFTPTIYSPDFHLVDDRLMDFVREKGMKIIPWTLNENPDIQRMLDIGVDGIISDYPDRVIALVSGDTP
ncbi:MAG: glycerophosphodiester phosphodiesterase family protein [Bacteroidia bacterium]|nr:glycerophosphodiester phosphodiesterase family protein [Bacteroidia bacterium]